MWPNTADLHHLCVVYECVQMSVWEPYLDTVMEHTAHFCRPSTSWVHFPSPSNPRFPLSCRLSPVITGRLISSDWQPCSHLALQSWCPRVSASRKAIVEVPLWLSLSFSPVPSPSRQRMKSANDHFELWAWLSLSHIQPSKGSHFLLKCLLLQITEVIFPTLQLEWL